MTYVDLGKLGVKWPQAPRTKWKGRTGLYQRDSSGLWLVRNAGLEHKTAHQAKAATMADVDLVLDTAVRDIEGFFFAEISECTIYYANRRSRANLSNYHDWLLVGDICLNRVNDLGHVRGYALTIHEIVLAPNRILQFLGLLKND